MSFIANIFIYMEKGSLGSKQTLMTDEGSKAKRLRNTASKSTKKHHCNIFLVISILEKEKKAPGFYIVITNYIFLDFFA